MSKLNRKQKVQDAKDKGWAKKAFRGALGDSRSEAPPMSRASPATAAEEDENEGMDVRVKDSSATRVNESKDTSLPTGGRDLVSVLEAQDRKADENGVDELT